MLFYFLELFSLYEYNIYVCVVVIIEKKLYFVLCIIIVRFFYLYNSIINKGCSNIKVNL